MIGQSKQDCIPHIPIIPWSPRWNLGILFLGQLALLIRTTLAARRHLGRKHSRRDTIDSDLEAGLPDLGREKLRQVDRGPLGSIVSEVVLGPLHEARDGGDVKNGARIAVLVFCRLLQQRQERSAQEVDLADVGPVHLLPHFEGLVFGVEDVLLDFFGRCSLGLVGRTCDAGVIDEHAETFLLLFELRDETLDIVFTGDVGGQGNDLAGDVLAICLGYTFQLFFGTAHNIY